MRNEEWVRRNDGGRSLARLKPCSANVLPVHDPALKRGVAIQFSRSGSISPDVAFEGEIGPATSGNGRSVDGGPATPGFSPGQRNAAPPPEPGFSPASHVLAEPSEPVIGRGPAVQRVTPGIGRSGGIRPATPGFSPGQRNAAPPPEPGFSPASHVLAEPSEPVIGRGPAVQRVTPGIGRSGGIRPATPGFSPGQRNAAPPPEPGFSPASHVLAEPSEPVIGRGPAVQRVTPGIGRSGGIRPATPGFSPGQRNAAPPPEPGFSPASHVLAEPSEPVIGRGPAVQRVTPGIGRSGGIRPATPGFSPGQRNAAPPSEPGFSPARTGEGGTFRNAIMTAIQAIALLLLPALAHAQNMSMDGKALIDSLMNVMTTEEKLGQLTQYRGGWSVTGPVAEEGGEEQIRAGHVGSFLSIYGAEYTKKLQRIAVEESRLGIPLLFAHDVIHGFRTIFPVPIAEASSFDPEAVENDARIAAIEASAAGLHWTYAPMVDIARDPRWGRIIEGSGEDPYLGSVMAAAKVHGFQGTDLSVDSTVLATAKHYVAYGAAEGGRDYNTADISERTLRDVYLPPFKAAVDAGVGSVMAAFNEIGGVPMHANKRLINGVLRGEWGWDGILVSDYTGILELIQHGVAGNRTDAGVLAINAGVDVDMVSEIYLKDLPAAIDDGRVDMETVDKAVRRVLDAKYELGLFEDPYRYSDLEREARLLLNPDHVAASRAMARKSIVLLKNESETLPLSKGMKTIAVIGPLADDARATLGGWAAAGRAEEAVTILQGIRDAFSDSTEVIFAKGADVQGDDMSGFEEAVSAADRADAVVMVLGEHQDMSAEALNRAHIGLPGVQRELAEVVMALGKPVVVVLMNGRPLAIPWLDEHAQAILETWFLGNEMGNAVADVLFGDYNPGGKLPSTFPVTVGQIPLYYNHKNTGRPPSATDKYTSKYIDAPWTPLYPFGYGLSYTTFSFSDVSVTPQMTPLSEYLQIKVGATVTNTGDRTGDEVVQVYIQDVTASVTRPVKELKRFKRITIDPGESVSISFTLSKDDLSFYGLDMKPVVEPGIFKVYVGSSSEDVTELEFELTRE